MRFDRGLPAASAGAARAGWPLELVRRALGAAEEELGHTRAAARLASLFASTSIAAVAPRCLNEGLAAANARAEACQTPVNDEARISGGLALEEASHEALAFDVLRWALSQAPALARDLQVPGVALRPKPNSSFLKPAEQVELAHHSALRAQRKLTELSA